MKASEERLSTKPAEHMNQVGLTDRLKLGTLAGEFTGRAVSAANAIINRDVLAKRPDVTRDLRQELLDKASDYSVGLDAYWSYLKRRVSDDHIYRDGGTPLDVQSLMAPLKDADGALQTQLKAWTEAISPYADHYDVDRIETQGYALSETLNMATAALALALSRVPLGDASAEGAWRFQSSMLLGLSGLADQISRQLNDLGAGKTVAGASLSNQTVETINRAENDEAKFALESQQASFTKMRDALRQLDADMVVRNQSEDQSLRTDIRDLRANHANDVDFESKLADLNTKVDALGVRVFYDALDRLVDNKDDPQWAKDRQKLGELNISFFTSKDPNKRAELTTTRAALVGQLIQKMQQGLDGVVTRQSSELQDYSARLKDNIGRFDDDSVGFWSTSKKTLLANIEVIAGKDTRKVLDNAFGSGGLSDKIKNWIDIAKATNPKPEKLQSIAVDVLTTTEDYIRRASAVLQDAGADPALVQLKNELVSALTAIKLSVAKNLKFQFQTMHRFD